MSKIWSTQKNDRVEMPDNVKIFISEFEELCKKHDLSISHEDGQGAFVIEWFDEQNIERLKRAIDVRMAY